MDHQILTNVQRFQFNFFNLSKARQRTANLKRKPTKKSASLTATPEKGSSF